MEVLKQLETLPIVIRRKDSAMPMGKGTYGSKKGRPAKKLTASQKKLPPSLQKKIMASRKKKS